MSVTPYFFGGMILRVVLITSLKTTRFIWIGPYANFTRTNASSNTGAPSVSRRSMKPTWLISGHSTVGSDRPIAGMRLIREYQGMRRTRSACCARTMSGHVAAAPPRTPRNSRRLMSALGLRTDMVAPSSPLRGTGTAVLS